MSKKYIILMLAFLTLRINSFDLINREPQGRRERREAQRMDLAKLLGIIAVVLTVDTVVTQLNEGPSGEVSTLSPSPSPAPLSSITPTASPSATPTPDVHRAAEEIRQQMLKQMLNMRKATKLESDGQEADRKAADQRNKRFFNSRR